MMTTLPPGSPPIDMMGAYAIIALVADPVTAKKRLDELAAERMAADKAVAVARAENEQARVTAMAAQKEAQEARDLAAKTALARETLIKQTEELQLAATAISEREQQHAKQAAERDAAMDQRAADLDRRESKLADAETKLAADRTKFDADRAALESNLALMRQVKPI